ncbi:helix-turn-helix domain-containing protein [Micromonospora sp. NPDC048843]|uniref:helix-turn-helix transcriptional regulator n=1 Tax=Micromonospora sp. NPDC048843 TaxID=3155389 RepID=UPI0033DED3C3
MEKYLTTEELAALTRSTPGTVRYWRHMGKGPRGIKRGKRVLYAESDVAAWLAEDDQAKVAA